MTLRELSYDLYNIIHAGRGSDSELVSIYQIIFWIKQTRNTLIRQDIQKGRSISENIIQHIKSQKLIPIDISDAPTCLNDLTGCYIARTERKMPRFLELPDRDLFLSLQPSNILSQNYNIIPRNRVSYIGRGKWGKNAKYAFLREGYVFVVNDPDTEYITIEGVFQDPEELSDYVDCTTDKSCYDDETEFPLSSWMWEIMKQMILKTNGLILQSGTDISEDGIPNVAQPTQQPQR